MSTVTTVRFERYDSAILPRVFGLLEDLSPVPERVFLEQELFKEEHIVLSETDLKESIVDALEYQEYLASAISNLVSSSKNPRSISHFWECFIDRDYETFNYLNLNLYISDSTERGRIIYPAHIIRGDDSNFYFWDVINEEDALDAASTLLELGTK